MNAKRLATALLLAMVPILLGACQPGVRSQVIAVHELNPDTAHCGSIRVLPFDKTEVDVAQFERYAEKVRDGLSRHGFTVLRGKARTDYLALLRYGENDGTVVTRETLDPIWGPTGFDYEGVPEYGIIAYVPRTWTSTVYKRFVRLFIYELAPAIKEAARVYEAQVTSYGPCPSFASVAPQMLEALFVDFPGKSNEARDIKIAPAEECED